MAAHPTGDMAATGAKIQQAHRGDLGERHRERPRRDPQQRHGRHGQLPRPRRRRRRCLRQLAEGAVYQRAATEIVQRWINASGMSAADAAASLAGRLDSNWVAEHDALCKTPELTPASDDSETENHALASARAELFDCTDGNAPISSGAAGRADGDATAARVPRSRRDRSQSRRDRAPRVRARRARLHPRPERRGEPAAHRRLRRLAARSPRARLRRRAEAARRRAVSRQSVREDGRDGVDREGQARDRRGRGAGREASNGRQVEAGARLPRRGRAGVAGARPPPRTRRSSGMSTRWRPCSRPASVPAAIEIRRPRSRAGTSSRAAARRSCALRSHRC